MRLRLAAHLGLRAPDRPLFLASAGPDMADQIRWIASHGFAGLFDNFAAIRPADEQARLGDLASNHALDVGSFALDPEGWSTPLWNREDDDARRGQAALVARAVEVAARTGSRSVSCVTGRDPTRPRAAQRAVMAANLSRVGDAALAGGIMLCVEPVAASFIPGLLVERVAEARDIVAKAAHPAIRLAFDVGHIAMAGDDPVAALRDVPMPGLVQIADAPGRIDPGAGDVDWKAVFTALAATGYDGLIEVETEAMRAGLSGEAALLARLQEIDRLVSG